MKNYNDYIKGYKVGLEEGKREAMIELQKTNVNSDLPSNETLYKIFNLLFEAQDAMKKTNSCYMNTFEYYANSITKNWNKNG